MTNEELLKVLDMSEDSPKQCAWLQKYAWHHRTDSQALEDFHRDCKSGYREISLADLAFRLRDEAVNKNYSNWLHAGQTVYDYAKKEFPYRTPGYLTWFSVSAKPIHWIIAALIAKESK